MNETDLDIVLAIADRRLTGQPRQDALERIAANPELGEAVKAQIAALDELAKISPAAMTASERATLRANLIEQLNLQPAPPGLVPERQRRPWWQPVLGLASAAALVLAIVVVPGLFTGSDDSGADTVAVAPESSGLEDAGGVSATASGETSVITIPEVAQQDIIEFFADTSNAIPQATTNDVLEDGTDTAGDAAEENTVEKFAATAPSVGLPLATIGRAELEDCITALAEELPQGTLIPLAVTTTDDGPVVHLGIATADGIAYSVSIALESCTITTAGP